MAMASWRAEAAWGCVHTDPGPAMRADAGLWVSGGTVFSLADSQGRLVCDVENRLLTLCCVHFCTPCSQGGLCPGTEGSRSREGSGGGGAGSGAGRGTGPTPGLAWLPAGKLRVVASWLVTSYPRPRLTRPSPRTVSQPGTSFHSSTAPA